MKAGVVGKLETPFICGKLAAAQLVPNMAIQGDRASAARYSNTLNKARNCILCEVAQVFQT
jgi:hypothetical protein